MSVIHKVFQKMEEETLSNSFYKASVTGIPKQDKDIRKLQTNIPHEYKCRNSQ